MVVDEIAVWSVPNFSSARAAIGGVITNNASRAAGAISIINVFTGNLPLLGLVHVLASTLCVHHLAVNIILNAAERITRRTHSLCKKNGMLYRSGITR